jgi:hypothetical protein
LAAAIKAFCFKDASVVWTSFNASKHSLKLITHPSTDHNH